MSPRIDRLAKLRRLTGREKRILCLALVLMPTIDFGLRLFGFRRVQAALASQKPREPLNKCHSRESGNPFLFENMVPRFRGDDRLGLNQTFTSTEVDADNDSVSRRAAEVARLVAAATQYGPHRASCLPVTLTLSWLLRRQGIMTDLRLGVRKVAARLEAHAWVEYQGLPLIDDPDVHERFAAFDQAVAPTIVASR